MREYILYVKRETHRTKAYITPCFEVDKLFWEERNQHSLCILGKSTSLALVFALREQVNAFLQQNSTSVAAVEPIREMLSTYTREVNEWRVREGKPFHFSTLDIEQEQARIAQESVHDISSAAQKLLSALQGRSLLWEEAETLLQKREIGIDRVKAPLQWLVLLGCAEWKPGVTFAWEKGWLKHRLLFICERCGNSNAIRSIYCHSCLQGCAYCEDCLQMGRSKCCTPYLCVPYAGREQAGALVGAGSTVYGSTVRTGKLLDWDGAFSPMQARAAGMARQFAARGHAGAKQFLIWAVCGAGKTELIFPAIEQVLLDGGTVCIATPRKDVVFELAPRIAKVFPQQKVISVYGESSQKWETADIVISTTHQMLRFYRRFALIIVDEVDAFPFHNNAMLYRAVDRAVAADGKILYLSATPSAAMQKQLVQRSSRWLSRTSRRRLSMSSPTHVIIPARFHGFPLPVPKTVVVHQLHKKIAEGKPIPSLTQFLKKSLQEEKQVFIFVPRISDIGLVLQYLQQYFPDYTRQMEGVHAADPKREEKVLLFRNQRYRMLVTTTILERGVTIPRSDCLVIGAEAPVFDEASLVQVAGRVGRSADCPDGAVLFLLDHRVQAPFKAVQQIKSMNSLAQTAQK